VQDHHVQRDPDRAWQAVDDHANRIADEDQVAMRVDDLRRGRVIGRQADDRIAALARRDLRRA
jgi:hypothetical protein